MPCNPATGNPKVRPYRFCPACGATLAVQSPSSRVLTPECRSCGGPLACGPVPAVGVAVVESDRVLLIRRRFAPMQGSWAIPGGFVEGREAPEATARREIEEETGLVVRLAGVMGAYRGAQGHVLFVCYRGVIRGGRLCPGDDASEAGFFPLWKLPEPLAVGPHPIVIGELRSSLARRAGSP